jgi:hypothetical protein
VTDLDTGWVPAKPDPLLSRAVVEWDWVVAASYSRLHAPLVWDDPEYNASVEDGRTVCGLSGYLTIPGLFSRMGLPRCAHCCRMTGMPPGTGSPKNDDACRPIVERRLQAITSAAPDPEGGDRAGA